jgi:GTP-binding protein
VAVQPPTIVLICNDPRAFAPDYRRYLLGTIRDQLPFGEVPVKLYLHRRSRGTEGGEDEQELAEAGESE